MDARVEGMDRILADGQDHRAFAALARAIACDDAIAFVGAGISARVGYTDWNELLGKLRAIAVGDGPIAQKLGATLEKDSDITWRADVYRGLLKGEKEADYFKLLNQHFSPRGKQDEALDLLARLPFGFFVTTNYDDSLETALRAPNGDRLRVCDWADDAGVREFMDSFVSREETVSLIYLHGRYDHPENIVLCERDYARRYVRSDETVRRLFALFSMRRVVFFGFSMTDPDIMSVLRQVNASLGHDEPRHFAILPGGAPDDSAERKNARDRLASKFGVRAIYYVSNNGHGPLAGLLRQLAEASRDAAEKASAAGGAEGPYADVLWRYVNAPPRGRRRSRGLGMGFTGDAEAGESGAAAGPDAATEFVITERPPASPATPVPGPPPALPDLSALASWKDSDEFKRAPADPDDPVRGRFGGSAARHGLELSATMTADERSGEWFRIHLEVRPTQADRPLTGAVEFHLHPTFEPRVMPVGVVKGVAATDLLAWGAFTVGALADDGRTPLELNLAELSIAPAKFRSR